MKDAVCGFAACQMIAIPIYRLLMSDVSCQEKRRLPGELVVGKTASSHCLLSRYGFER
jgi:hypothetical protein